MPLQHNGIRLDDRTVRGVRITERRAISSVRVADRGHYCAQFVGQDVNVSYRLDRSHYGRTTGKLVAVIHDLSRNQAMLLLLRLPGSGTLDTVYVGHLVAFRPGGGE